MGMPRGVDLNLDCFNLSAIAETGTWAGTMQAPLGAEKFSFDSKAFWLNVDGGEDLAVEDVGLFRDVFNPHMSDRREEGDRFVPPQTGLSYQHRLKLLVGEETEVARKRKEHFFSGEFVADSSGPLFPASWSSTIGSDAAAARAKTLVPRPDLQAEQTTLRHILDASAPHFDRRAEDGARFLVYRVGSLEVRAVSDRDGEMHIGAVYAAADSAAAPVVAGQN
eukprot:CAMPEP_0198507602 /NCGR_PEP_ID=MMETSP1462-20131121/12426_1 /TAXON_ID=1333877 /ORGANISM="Brandtodinium nutriculum, Strain RCC3387" /LENGTH=221 /DNA_ID=CAMNT_0044236851 /DNA_START=16 /DNA_END=681 /DNA_ORIENTATION=+